MNCQLFENHRVQGSRSARLIPLLLAGFALACVLVTIDEPGLTVDEPYQVAQGEKIARALLLGPREFSRPRTIQDVWQGAEDRPPLTRLFVGISHHLLQPNPQIFLSPKLGRFASAIAFAVIVGLVARFGWQLAGPVAAATSGITCSIMPRLFAHAHLASPEIISSAFVLAALMTAGWAFSEGGRGKAEGGREISHSAFRIPQSAFRIGRLVLAGVVLGLALLTKMTAILLVLGVVIAHLRFGWLWAERAPLRVAVKRVGAGLWRGSWPLAIWIGVGAVVFVAGWPWLWPLDFPDHPSGLEGSFHRLQEFFERGVSFEQGGSRITIYVWYLGQRYPNPESGVPWHFVWVFFFVTVPVGLQALGLFFGLPRCFRMLKSSVPLRMLLGTIAVTLGFFTLPIDRYDGERLFLLVFPMWAIVIGVGGAALVDFLLRWIPRKAAMGVLGVLLISQGYGLVKYHPYQLSYYNLLVGGLAGAEKLGLEVTYWGDSLSEPLLEQYSELADPGDQAVLLPTLYEPHANFLTSPSLQRKNQRIRPEHLPRGCKWAILFHRQGYLNDPDGIARKVLRQGEVVAEIERDGVWLSRVYRLAPKMGSKDIKPSDIFGAKGSVSEPRERSEAIAPR